MIVDGGVIYYSEQAEGEMAPGQKPSDSYESWMRIANGTPLRGAVSTVNGEEVTHTEYDRALYFYENCQGNYPGQKKYDKRQQWDEVGFNPKPGQYDYKDNIEYGTYVEVEAYYVSTNVNQVSNGPIKYRFMLGQNCEFDYDAFRNHHYKLTLGFRGYANQPDWHIEYVEPDVTFYTDPTYYVSYAYNNKAIFPVRFKGEVEEFDVQITHLYPEGDGTRSMMLQVTDPGLLKATGGIVQGMSGSPILQNGRLVGAVTHVLVNDPTRGYGILAESMLEQAVWQQAQVS